MKRGSVYNISFLAKARARVLAGLRDWPHWLGVLLLFATLEIAVLSLEQARWIEPQPPLSLVLVLALAAGWALSATRLNSGMVTLIMAVLGTGATYWLGVIPELTGGRAIFSVLLTAITWIAGMISIWALVRHRNAWVGVISGAAVMVVNLSNLPDTYFYFFGFYFLAAMLFIVHVRLSRHSSGQRRRFLGQGRVFLFVTLAIITAAGTLFAWAVPKVRVPPLQNTIASQLIWIRDVEGSSINIFASVPSKERLSTVVTRGDLGFGSNWHRDENVDYIIYAPFATYWRVNAYDVYTRDGWRNSPTVATVYDEDTAWRGSAVKEGSGALTYTVKPGIRTDSLLTGGTFVTADIPYVVHESAGQAMTVTAPRVLGEGETYTMTTALYVPTIPELASAEPGYPEAIGEVYLALPDDFPVAVRSLAGKITVDADNPYQKVVAIDRYLNRFPYKLDVTGPEPGQDGVEYFIFQEKAGFCTYFASAMAVMLRAVDVPARVAIGYLPGDPGENPGEYLLKDKLYHAWVQVWFDGYGWVDIEATPSGEGNFRGEVLHESPVVSAIDTAQLPPWEIWYQQFLYPSSTPPAARETTPTPALAGPPGPLAFSDELGLALMVIGIMALIALVLMVPVLFARSAFNRWVWGVDRADLAARTYLRMGKLAALVQLGPAPSQTPAEYSAALAQAMPEQAGNLETITRAYTEKKFGRAGNPNLFEEAEILKARRSVYDALLSRFGFLRRFLERS